MVRLKCFAELLFGVHSRFSSDSALDAIYSPLKAINPLLERKVSHTRSKTLVHTLKCLVSEIAVSVRD